MWYTYALGGGVVEPPVTQRVAKLLHYTVSDGGDGVSRAVHGSSRQAFYALIVLKAPICWALKRLFPALMTDAS